MQAKENGEKIKSVTGYNQQKGEKGGVYLDLHSES